MKFLFCCLLVGSAVAIMGCPDNGAVSPIVEDVGDLMTNGDQTLEQDILAEEEYRISAREFESAVKNEAILVFANATSAMQDAKVITLLRKIERWAAANCRGQSTAEQPLLHVAFSTRAERDAFKEALAKQIVGGQGAGWSYVPILNVYIIDNTSFFYALALSIICG